MAENKKYLHNIDVVNNKVMNLLLNPLTTVQRTAVGSTLGLLDQSYVCYDTTLNKQYFWDGTQWVTAGGGGGVNQVNTSAPLTGGPITNTGTIGITNANTSTDGYLSSTDWNTFNGKFTLPSLTAGSVLFSNGTTIAQDNANFFWDDTNNRLGIGTATPTYKLDVNGDQRIAGYLNFKPSAAPTSIRIGANDIQNGGSSPNNDRLVLIGNNVAVNLSAKTTNEADSLIAIGYAAASSTTTGGAYSIYLGRNSGNGITTGRFNTHIGGSDVGNILATTENTIHITAGSYEFNNGSNNALNGLTTKYAYIGGGYDSATYINDFYLGANPFVAQPEQANLNLYSPSATIANIGTWGGVNAPGSNFVINAGRGTGTGTPGDFIVKTATKTTSGNTLQTLAQRVKVAGDTGEVTVNNLATGGADQMVTADNNGKLKIQTISSGTVTGVTATAPLTSSGGTAPVISTSMSTNKLIGRSTAGVGVMEEITVGSGLTLTGVGVLNNTATPTPLGYYGAFQDITNQYAAAINTGYPMLLGITDLSNQVAVVSGSRVTIYNSGIYNIQWSAQFTNPTANEHDVTIWLRKNGIDVPGSAGIVLVPAKHGAFDGHTLPSWNFLLDVVGGDYYEFVWSTANTSVYISFNPAGNPPPSTASVVLTVTQQSGIMAGTGITAINSLTGAAQTLGVGTSGTDFAIVSSGTSHTFNLPTASASNRGALSSSDFTNFNTAYTDRLKWDGGSSGLVAATGRTSLGLGTFAVANYPTWASGTPFVKMTAAGTFSLDTNTYLTSVGTGTTNELTYWSGANTLGSLTTATYPSLTELSYVKGVTSGIQTQLNGKQTDSAWVDCSSNSISGWASTTTKLMQYKLLGSKTMIFQFSIVGTGTSGGTASITLPFTSSTWGDQTNILRSRTTATLGIGIALVSASSTTLNIYPSAAMSTWNINAQRDAHGTIIINLA